MTSETQNLIKSLTSKGLVGVMISLILLAGSAIWILYKITSNHIEHSQKAWERQTEATYESTQMISEAINKNTQVMSGLDTLIREKLK